ncbi:993_t:CDS:2, partial [Funneliformis caledonium]
MSIDGNPNSFKITLDEQITYLEKDFIIVFKSKDLDQSRAFVEYNPETETNCVMLTLVPKFTLNTTELIFVIDSDGPMKRAAQALELLLRSLPEDCYIISFGSRYDSLFPKSQLSKALNLAQMMTSNYGGTEIFRVLNWAFENSRKDMPTSVFLITDDEVRKVDQYTSENEEKMNDDLRLFALGIVHSVSHNLIESIARAGKGYAQFVTNNERMDKKAIEMLKNAVKSPIKITWTDANVSESTEKEGSEVESPPPQLSNIFTDIKIKQAPHFIPPLRNGDRFVVYCTLEKSIEPCKVITLNGSMKLDISLEPTTLQGSKIHKLARKLIKDLENGESFLHRHPKNV